MRKLFLVVYLFIVGCLQSFSQEAQPPQPQFLFSPDKDIRFSGFGGPLVEFSNVDDAFGVFVGGGGAAIINQTFFFGGYGMGLVSDQPRYSIHLSNENIAFDNLRPQIGHGGLWLGYIHQSHKIMHWALSAKIGWGGISYTRGNYENLVDELGTDGIFVFTPQAELEVNLFTWFKLNLGVGYRYVAGADARYLTPSGPQALITSGDLRSPIGTLTLLFGNFIK